MQEPTSMLILIVAQTRVLILMPSSCREMGEKRGGGGGGQLGGEYWEESRAGRTYLLR